MQPSKVFTAFITLCAFTFNGIPVVQADAVTAASSSLAVPNYISQGLPTLPGMQNMLKGQVMSCDMQFPVEDASAVNPTDAASKLTRTFLDKYKAKAKKGAVKSGGSCEALADNAPDSEKNCEMTCGEPKDLENIGTECNDYFDISNNLECKKVNDVQRTLSCSLYTPKITLAEDGKRLTRFTKFMTWKKTNCTKKNADAIGAQLKNYKCKVELLSKAMSDAAGVVQSALAANNKSYGFMMQFQGQVGEQMSQIDEILGPDRSDPNKGSNNSQFQGLLGVQAALNAKLPTWTAGNASNKSAVEKISKDYVANDQALVANQMQTVSDCMKGNTNLNVSGGRSLTCFKPAMSTDKDGKPIPVNDSNGNAKYTMQACGALEYVRSQITQSAFKGGLKSNSIIQQSQTDGAAFDSFVSGMLRDLGASDPSSKDGSGKVLQVRVADWSTLQSKYSANMQELSARTGVNVTAQMQTIANSCFNEGKTWVEQQKSSAGSNYSQKVQEINSRSNELKSKMDSDLSAMSGEFSSAVAAMGGSATYQCKDPTNISQEAKCYADIQTKLSDMLNGTGTAGTSIKTINGGSMVAGFGVSCRGVNNCVNTYKSIRTQKKAQLTNAKKATEDFVTKSNNMINDQLQSYAQGLSALQQQASAQFLNMQIKLSSLGIESTAEPKYTDPAQFELGGSKETGPGPYQMPKGGSISAILSGYVQPTGLMDFKNMGGANQMLSEANKEDKKLATDMGTLLSTYTASDKKLKSLASSCKKGHEEADLEHGTSTRTADSSAHNDTDTSKEACQAAYNSCSDNPKSQPSMGVLGLVAKALLSGKVDETKMDDLNKQMNSLKDTCSSIVVECPKYFTGISKGASTGAEVSVGPASEKAFSVPTKP